MARGSFGASKVWPGAVGDSVGVAGWASGGVGFSIVTCAWARRESANTDTTKRKARKRRIGGVEVF